jgi:hypothetical protein
MFVNFGECENEKETDWVVFGESSEPEVKKKSCQFFDI